MTSSDDTAIPPLDSFVESFIQIYTKSPLAFAASDICSSEATQSENRIAAFAFAMSTVLNEEHKLVVKRIVIIVPPDEAGVSISESAIATKIADCARYRFRRQLSDRELSVLRNRIVLVRSRDLRVESALEAIGIASEQDAVIISFAASYRASIARPASSRPLLLEEDRWVHHLVELAQGATESAKRLNCYILMDTCEAAPQRDENRNALMSITDCGYFTITFQNDPWEIVAAHSDDWIRALSEGRVGSVFHSIDALPGWMDSQKSFLKLQLLDRVAPGLDALKPVILSMLRSEMSRHPQLDPPIRVKLANIALRAGDKDLAAELLRPARSQLIGQEDLESATQIAGELSADELCDAAVQRLASLYPRSATPFRRSLNRCFDERRFSDAVVLLHSPHLPLDDGSEFFFGTLATGLQSDEMPQYANIIQAIAEKVPAYEGWARRVCGREALARRDFGVAIELCLPGVDEPLESGGARLLLHVLQQVMLQRTSDSDFILGIDQLAVPVVALLKFLAEHPTDRIRVGLEDLLSVETTGNTGLAVSVYIVVNTASLSISRERTSRPRSEGKSAIDLKSFLGKVYEWMSEEDPVILHTAKIPPSLLPASPDDMFDELLQFIRFEQDLRNDETAKIFELIVKIGILLAKHTSTLNADLDLIRYAAARLISSNRMQLARDLAETALALAGDSAERRRFAWLVFGDVYHRSHNNIAALLGIGCMFQVAADADVEQVWQEGYLLVRILRDLDFYDAAKTVLVQIGRAHV